MSRWPTTDALPALTVCSAIALPAALTPLAAAAATTAAEAAATVVSTGRLSAVLGALPGASLLPDGSARIVIAPAVAPGATGAPAAAGAGAAARPPAAAATTAAAEAASGGGAAAGGAPGDGTLRGDTVVAVSVPAAPRAGGAPAQLIVAFN